MGLLAPTKEKRTQLYFYDDPRAKFRKLEFDGTALVEPTPGNANQMFRAFKHYYKTEFDFDGFGNVSADRVTLGFGRDIVLEPVPMLTDEERPPKRAGLKSDYITQIGAHKRYVLTSQKHPATIWDKITVGGLIIDVLLIVGIMLKIAVRAWA